MSVKSLFFAFLIIKSELRATIKEDWAWGGTILCKRIVVQTSRSWSCIFIATDVKRIRKNFSSKAITKCSVQLVTFSFLRNKRDVRCTISLQNWTFKNKEESWSNQTSHPFISFDIALNEEWLKCTYFENKNGFLILFKRWLIKSFKSKRDVIMIIKFKVKWLIVFDVVTHLRSKLIVRVNYRSRRMLLLFKSVLSYY